MPHVQRYAAHKRVVQGPVRVTFDAACRCMVIEARSLIADTFRTLLID